MKALIVAAALIAQQPGFSSPAAKPCLTRAEAAAMGGYFMPAIIDGVARKCTPVLSKTAFLAGQHRPLSARLRQSQAGQWPRAKAAIEKVSGKKLPSIFGEEFTQKMAESIVTEMVVKEVATADCGKVSELVGSVAPLPAENFGRLFSALMELDDSDDARKPFRMCPAGAA